MHANHDRATKANKTDRLQTAETLELKNSRVRLETGPAGTLARIDRATDSGHEREYAGPLPDATVRALREVAQA